MSTTSTTSYNEGSFRDDVFVQLIIRVELNSHWWSYPSPRQCIIAIWVSQNDWLDWHPRIKSARLKFNQCLAIRTGSFREGNNLWPIFRRFGAPGNFLDCILTRIGIISIDINWLSQANNFYNIEYNKWSWCNSVQKLIKWILILILLELTAHQWQIGCFLFGHNCRWIEVGC